VGARILWRDAQNLEGSIDLGAAEVRIGRAMDCAIRTDDAMVSRHHARVYWGGQGFVLEDLGSANGVYYQEQRVQSHVFKHGDAVRCGSLWLRYVDLAMLGQAAPDQPPQPVAMGGMGAVGHQGPTGQPAAAVPPSAAVPAQVGAQGSSSASMPVAGANDSDEEIRRLRRRIEQVQAELRIMRGGKVGADKARKMEDLENDLAAAAEEKERLEKRVSQLEEQIAREGGNVKVQRAVEIRGKAAEIVTQLNDLLSSLRIEVMAAEGEFEQYSHTIPRASFELIRQSLKESSQHVDSARDLLRQLREVAG
jgi:hypothetical protein